RCVSGQWHDGVRRVRYVFLRFATDYGIGQRRRSIGRNVASDGGLSTQPVPADGSFQSQCRSVQWEHVIRVKDVLSHIPPPLQRQQKRVIK
ncbi:hypothetical protein PFISCL1PPCAC_21693, partial [Pristionchus fissidentatus]